jgi:hypothetical protein
MANLTDPIARVPMLSQPDRKAGRIGFEQVLHDSAKNGSEGRFGGVHQSDDASLTAIDLSLYDAQCTAGSGAVERTRRDRN